MPPATAHNHQQCIDRALACANRICAQRGLRFTPARRRVLELIWSDHQAVKAYDLLDKLKASDPSAKPTTVYRALDFLLEQGLIHRVESLNAFVGCDHADTRHDQLLLICERCNTVEERSAAAVLAAASQEAQEADFSARRRTFEIHGLCRHCRSADNSASPLES